MGYLAPCVGSAVWHTSGPWTDDAGYPWDTEKAEALRDKYSAIATHVEDLS